MIKYLVGDATNPVGDGPKIIAHVCNDVGGWGRGFVLSLRKRYPIAEESYRRWSRHEPPYDNQFKLGEVQLVLVEDNMHVANMIGQHDVVWKDGIAPIRYDAIELCLTQLRELAIDCSASVHMPRIGCGLAGGEWSKIEEIIGRLLKDVDVYVYDLPIKDSRIIPWRK